MDSDPLFASRQDDWEFTVCKMLFPIKAAPGITNFLTYTYSGLDL